MHLSYLSFVGQMHPAQVSLMACGRYCFVQFQNAELATRAITIFDDTDALQILVCEKVREGM